MTQDELLRDAPVRFPDEVGLPWAVRQLVLARDNWACVCCDKPVLGRPYAIHPRKPGYLGGRTSPENLITVLAGCGERIGARSDPGDVAKGYSIRSYDEPAVVPVLYRSPAGQKRVWLLPDGGRAFEPPSSAVINDSLLMTDMADPEG